MAVHTVWASLKNTFPVSQVLLIGYGIFMAGFLLVPTAAENYHQKFYYYVLFFIGILKLPKSISLVRSNPVFITAAVYIVYMVASGIWTQEPYGDGETAKLVFKTFEHAILILMFVLMTALIREAHPQQFEYLLQILCVAAAVSSILTLLIWYSANPFPGRIMTGFTVIRQPLHTVYTYGLFSLIAAHYFLKTQSMSSRTILGLATITLLAYVVLAQSRMALGATLMGLAILTLGSRTRRGVWLALLLTGSLAVVAVAVFPDLSSYLFGRGTSYRPEIWNLFIDRFMESPFFGEGYLSDPRVYIDVRALTGYVYPHSAYVATLSDGGLVGLALLIALLGCALWWALQSVKKTGSYTSLALVLYLIACIATDTDRLIRSVGAIWVVVWFPIALILTDRLGSSRN